MYYAQEWPLFGVNLSYLQMHYDRVHTELLSTFVKTCHIYLYKNCVCLQTGERGFKLRSHCLLSSHQWLVLFRGYKSLSHSCYCYPWLTLTEATFWQLRYVQWVDSDISSYCLQLFFLNSRFSVQRLTCHTANERVEFIDTMLSKITNSKDPF